MTHSREVTSSFHFLSWLYWNKSDYSECYMFSAETGSAAWTVTFENPNPCALKGSSVNFRCTYNYTDGETVRKTTWHKGQLKGDTWTRVKISDLSSYHNRTKYLGDLQHNCRLAIHDVQDNDYYYYYFRFDTNKYGRHSKESVYLSVSGKIIPNTVLPCKFDILRFF